MDDHSAVSLHDEYPTGEHELDFFQAAHGLPLSAGGIPFQFQGNTQFQDVNAVSAPPHLFRNSITTAHNVQSQESHSGFLPLQQMHASLGHSQQAFDASRVLPSRPGQQATALKKPEDPDAACRPRLTPEQTQFLEDIFSHTPRPTTQQKKRHAIDLGLTHEKVNNWFQNRRAKSKQMNRIRKELSIMTADNMQLSQWNDNLSAYANHGLASPLQLTDDHQAMLSMMSQDQASNGQASLGPAWNNPPSGSVSSASYSSHEELAAAMNHGISIIPGALGGSLAPQATHDFSPLGKGLGEAPPGWTFNTNVMNADASLVGHPDAVDMNQVLLSTQASQNSPSKAWDQSSASADGTVLAKQENDTSSPSAGALQSHTNSAIVSQHTTPQRSPSPKPSAARPQPLSSDSFIRRDSSASELANGINTFHLQKLAAQPSSSDEEVFKTPKVPSLSLLARRKKGGTAALQPLRTVSASNVNESLSSSNSTVMPPSAVRRIKSASNSLNVFTRVHKSGASSAQRSPLSQTFRDASVLERLHSQMTSMNGGDSSNQSQYSNSSPEAHMTQWAISPAESYGAAPPLSASFTQNSYEEPTWAISPPITPIYKQGLYAPSFAEVPQSAPAHITAFSTLSPTPSSHPATSSAFYSSQHYQDPSFFAPVPMSAALHSQNHILKSYDAEMAQPSTTIMRPESGGAPGSGCYGFFSTMGAAQPVKEQKELEVIIVPFPTPEQRPMSLPRQGAQGGVWSFQNTGPKDYATTD